MTAAAAINDAAITKGRAGLLFMKDADAGMALQLTRGVFARLGHGGKTRAFTRVFPQARLALLLRFSS
jgi:hypothetical protein